MGAYGAGCRPRHPPHARDSATTSPTSSPGSASFTPPSRPGHPSRCTAPPVRDQWLDDGATLGLVDFDRFCWSDPELDAATFLGALEFDTELRQSIDDLRAALLDGFRRSSYVIDERRWAAYRVDIRLRKVARTAMAIRPDGDERAARHLGAVADALRAAERLA